MEVERKEERELRPALSSLLLTFGATAAALARPAAGADRRRQPAAGAAAAASSSSEVSSRTMEPSGSVRVGIEKEEKKESGVLC